MFIDTHAHYYLKHFNKDRDKLLSEIRDNGIGSIINAAISYESNFDMMSKLNGYKDIYYAVGIHPNRVGTDDSMDEVWMKGLHTLATSNKSVVAIGETGLDFHRLSRNEEGKLDEISLIKLSRQYKWFRYQIGLSVEMGLPLVIHVRDAYSGALSVLEEFQNRLTNGRAGVVHCFTGNADVADKYLNLGFSLGIGGAVTMDSYVELRNAIKQVPLSRIVLETDAPYVTPSGVRDKRNNSLNIPLIAETIAVLKGVSLSEVENTTTENAIRLFNLF